MPDDPIRADPPAHPEPVEGVRALGRNAPTVILGAVALFAAQRLSRRDLAGRGRDGVLVTTGAIHA